MNALPPARDQKPQNCRPETRAHQPNPPECRRFSHTRHSRCRGRTGWLGRQDSNLGMAESKSTYSAFDVSATVTLSKSDVDDRVAPDMTEHTGTRAQSLTGVWQGSYRYPLGLGSVSFVATLIEAGNSLSGTTHELGHWALGWGPNVTLHASLSGSRHGDAVAFVKTYDGNNPYYRTIEYKGTLSGDGTAIEGRWIISRMWSGKFVMIRPARKAESVSRKVFEHA